MSQRVLSQRQEAVLRQLGPVVTKCNFYLGGGTALALQLSHRRSVDFDWFTATEFGNPQDLAERLQASGVPFVTAQVDEGTLHGKVRGVHVSFLRYPYRLVRATVRSGFDCRLASLHDLAAMKLAAIADRGAKKDFVDIFALGSDLSLQSMLGDYQRKYAVTDLTHLLCSLVYFEDANPQVMPPLLIRANWRAIKNTIAGWVKELAP